MAVKPEVGAAGGQRYPVLRSIQTFLGQMAEGGARAAPAVIKELLQNADDAGATEVLVVLDERVAPSTLSPDYAGLLGPALFVRNNARFRLKGEVEVGEPDDFTAICDVASGHKRAQATAAGRFGIGFNSVYFLTDTPLLFSRREIHVFDLLHRIFDADGWRFPLDDFPARSASLAGAAKTVLEWCLPKCVLTRSLGDLAFAPDGDYDQTVFRLPLRQSREGAQALYAGRFPEVEDRSRVLMEMVDEAARSVLYLKSICRVCFGVLRERDVEPVANVEITPCPGEFAEFLCHIREQNQCERPTEQRSCVLDRTITRRNYAEGVSGLHSTTTWQFHVRHVARFDDEELAILRAKLKRNGERAIPWVAVAVPVNLEACSLDQAEVASWRVFLPLLEEGPCGCVISGAFFVGPSRQRTEFRLHESDEGNRRTLWNQSLVQRALIDLLQDISADLPDLAPELLDKHPKEYINLFPAINGQDKEPASLTEFVGRCFSTGVWELHLRDIWNSEFGLLVGDANAGASLEFIPEWLLAYRDRFRDLSSEQRRFLRNSLGEALVARIGPAAGITVSRRVSNDVAMQVLRHASPPNAKDLRALLRLVAEREQPLEYLDGCWAFLRATDSEVVRFKASRLYVLDEPGGKPIIGILRELGLPFQNAVWISHDIGLPAILDEFHASENVLSPTTAAAVELLRRLPADNAHDQLSQDYAIRPVIDFLVQLPSAQLSPDIRLGFLVSTAHQKAHRRHLGVILLKPETPTPEDEALWEVWLRRLFAEVDPAFARELHRLLAVHPGCLEMLHASDCQVAIARIQKALELLHQVSIRNPDVFETLGREINAASEKSPDLATRVANVLLENADASWDSFDEGRRYTVLALPIHRRSDGRFISLVPGSGGDLGSVQESFNLQSQDDIEDAPIELPTCSLLQTANATVKRFYRRRVGIEEHGRIAVLKQVLRQIGQPNAASDGMLRYLVRYYNETLSRLEGSGDEVDKNAAQELRNLLSSALTVPCIDGNWEVAQQCVEVWQVADHLIGQGWSKSQLKSLLPRLFIGEHVASVELWARDLLPRLHRLDNHDSRQIAKYALRSESPDLSLAHRIRLLRDNWRDRPESGSPVSKAAGQLTVAMIVSRGPLAEAEFFDQQGSLPTALLRLLAPNAVDMTALSNEVALRLQEVPAVLDTFNVPHRSGRDLDTRLIERFAEVWTALNTEDRLGVLDYVGVHGLATKLTASAARLQTVLVATKPSTWRPASSVVSPRWVETKPPNLVSEEVPTLEKIAEPVRQVWTEWCGVRTFGQVFSRVVDGVTRAAPDKRAAAVKALYAWLECATPSPLTEEVLSDLGNRQWVMAERGAVREFQRPAEVLLHAGERILGARFWVPAVPLPELVRRGYKQIGFSDAPVATAETVGKLGECLAERATLNDEAAVHTYQLLEHILDQSDSLKEQWLGTAERLRVYRAFRREDRQLTAFELFIGDEDYKDDLSTGLLCLKVGSTLPKGLIALYRRLGVSDRPSFAQLLSALSIFDAAEPSARAAHGRLIRALDQLAPSPGEPMCEASVAAIRVLTCAGTYEPVSHCYWDEEFGQREHASAGHGGGRLIDATDRSTRNLIGWLRARRYEALRPLRAAAQVELAEKPQRIALTHELSYLLLPWQQWLQEAAREGSSLRDKLEKLGLTLPSGQLEIVPVENIRFRCRLADGQVIEQAGSWQGPLALGCQPGHIFVRPPRVGNGPAISPKEIGELDATIAREVAILLSSDASLIADLKPCVDEILATLERPSTVLRRLRETYRQHFLHQYHDQVADPEFAELFEEYQRTVRPSRRAEELEERMHSLLAGGFVRARREQIRGYGYDEFSVFAELLQNAEDAYIQRDRLGMEMPAICEVRYRYRNADDGARLLEVEHGGRPFNYWQHGPRQDRNLSRDVEGVLRSAGSFKPYLGAADSTEPDTPTIGRFGLGFKSVYLLTDCPEIHSGAWHFAIEAGCLPKEVDTPADLPQHLTRIRLPLRPEVEDLRDTSQLLNLLPFLRMIRRLGFQGVTDEKVVVDVVPTSVRTQEDITVEEVTVSGPGAVRTGKLRLLRCRSQKHPGQLALLIAQDGTPARWDEAFQYDLFAALPLKAKLGCGAAASHRFEVQSGRTHLVDVKGNAQYIDQIAGLLKGLIEGLCATTSVTTPLPNLLTRFWALWRWDRGDTECECLRKALARALVCLAESEPVVPTLDTQSPVALGQGPCFFFYELPDSFRDVLIAAHAVIPFAGVSVMRLARSNVVVEGVAGAYRRACEYAGARRSLTLNGIGWDEVAAAFRERAWFAERTELLCSLAACLNDDQSRKVAGWVALCHLLGEDRDGRKVHLLPTELLPRDFPGSQHLPRRFLRLLSAAYDGSAVQLLYKAGLRPRPTSDDLREWLHAGDLSANECIAILRYLADDSRYRENWDLAPVFRSPWFRANGTPISTREAADRGFIPDDVLEDTVFRAWLGLEDGVQAPAPTGVAGRRCNPSEVLTNLFAWWEINGAAWITCYEKRLYPGARPPVLGKQFDDRDRVQRSQWITLLLLGAFHTMGRTRFEQHRDFLLRCERKGWLDVFADGTPDARRWMQVLEEYLDDPAGTHDYYQWMKQFVSIFQISRWLSEYVDSFLNVDRIRQPFALDQIIAPRTSAFFSGGGPDAPSLSRTLGIGACFVLRELMRLRILRNSPAHRHCYVAPQRVCELVEYLGCSGLLAVPRADRSPVIHGFLIEKLGSERATFNQAFDLPLLALAEEQDLQNKLLGNGLPAANTEVDL